MNLVKGTTALLTLGTRSSEITGEDIPAPAGASPQHRRRQYSLTSCFPRLLEKMTEHSRNNVCFHYHTLQVRELSLLYSSESLKALPTWSSGQKAS